MDNPKTVLVTGASAGIGYELARLFAGKGYDLVIVARSKEKLDKLAEKLKEEYGARVIAIPKDLSLPTAAVELYNEIPAAGIDVHILVNNAGAGKCGLFHETDMARDMERGSSFPA